LPAWVQERFLNPLAVEDEFQLLASMIGHPGEIGEALALVGINDFRTDALQRIFRALLTLKVQGRAIDAASVHQQVIYAGDMADVGHEIFGDLASRASGTYSPAVYAARVAERGDGWAFADFTARLAHMAKEPIGPPARMLEEARAEFDRLAARRYATADNPLISGAMDSAAFDGTEYRHDWLINDVMVTGEPLVLAGPSKTMKTGVVVEAAVSLASGRSFLDLSAIPRPRSVFVLSAESGAASLQARMRQVCKAKGLNPGELPIQWFTRVQKLDTIAGCRNLESALRHFGSEVVMLDPSYLLIGGEATADLAGNLYKMGPLLAAVGDACLAAGASPIVVAHSNARVEVGKPMELAHIAYSGFQQWARQWWLLSRRTDYQDDGRHELFFRFGGSAGHTGLVNVDIEEGIFDRAGGGRRWEVQAQHATDARRAQKEERQAEELRQVHGHADKVLGAMVKILAAGNTVATRNAIKAITGLKPTEVSAGVTKLVGDGFVVETDGTVQCGRGHKPAMGIRRPESWSA
jgi:hypothetical protein